MHSLDPLIWLLGAQSKHSVLLAEPLFHYWCTLLQHTMILSNDKDAEARQIMSLQ